VKSDTTWCVSVLTQDNTLRQRTSNMCLELSSTFDKVQMRPCVGTDRQIWYWQRRTPDSQLQHSASISRL